MSKASEQTDPPASKNPMGRWTPLIVAAAAALLAFAISPGGADTLEEVGHYGFASVMPALVTLLLVFVTREVVSSMSVGIVTAGFVVRDLNVVDRFLIPSIGTANFAVILLVYLWFLGGLIGLWTRTGGARYFAEWARDRIVRGPKSARLLYIIPETEREIPVATTRPALDECPLNKPRWRRAAN